MKKIKLFENFDEKPSIGVNEKAQEIIDDLVSSNIINKSSIDKLGDTASQILGELLMRDLVHAEDLVSYFDNVESAKEFIELVAPGYSEDIITESKEQKYMVMNKTDGFFASPETMTGAEADKFIQDFPKRFKAQGYYLTSNREKIDPLDVELEKVPVDNDDQDDNLGAYTVEMDISIPGLVGNFRLKQGDKINIEEGKMPNNYRVKMKGATSEFSKKSIEEAIAMGTIKPE